MMCAVGRIHNGLKVVFCFRHTTPSHYQHDADLRTCIEGWGVGLGGLGGGGGLYHHSISSLASPSGLAGFHFL